MKNIIVKYQESAYNDHLRVLYNTTGGRTGQTEEPYVTKVTPHVNSF